MPLDKTVIAVGDSARLEIIFYTGHYRNEVYKSPHIETNETNPYHYVTLRSVVTPDTMVTAPLIIEPWKSVMYQMTDSIIDSRNCIISNSSSDEIHLSVISLPKEQIEFFDFPGSLPAGMVGTGRIELSQTGISQSFDKSITIECDDYNRTRFTIPITRVIRH